MNSNQRSNIVLYSFIGDALSLGPHWIYNQSEIAAKAGNISGYLDPISKYHPGKKAGDFTHYGDQTLVLLRSLAKEGRFNLESFADDWRSFWENNETTSYKDGATQATLTNLQNGIAPTDSASPSNDIAGAARIAPLFLLQWNSIENLVAAARAQTAMSHGDPAVIETAEFFARVAWNVAEGQEVTDALKDVAQLEQWSAIPSEWFASAQASSTSGQSPDAAAKQHGLTCHVPDAFPVVCDLLLRYPNDPVAGLAANAQAGGDSAARGLLLGLVYGAQPNPAPVPEHWVSGLAARSTIDELITQLS